MVAGDFSTSLEMTGMGDVRRSDFRRQTGDAACGLYFPYGGEHGVGVWTFGPILRAPPSSILRKEPALRSILWSHWSGGAWCREISRLRSK